LNEIELHMIKKIITFFVLSAIAALAWLVKLKYGLTYSDKLFYSFVAISASYFFLKLLLEGVISQRIKESKARYSFRKTTQLLFMLVSFIIVLRIWIPNPQALLVAYGLVGAGVAISLQDVFKNFAGALSIFLSGIYRVGDRIEMNGKCGDVIDIGPFYTTLIELREWIDGDQTTGRILFLPNGQVLSYPVHNYTKEHNFLWDEIALPITHDSDWKKAIDIIQGIVKQETSATTKQVEQEISHLEETYYLSKRNIEPAIFITPTENWIMLRIRYVADVRDRRLVRNKLSGLILDAIQKSTGITIASETLTITSSVSPLGSN
jgi:small-conductance mechanosensitive channel